MKNKNIKYAIICASGQGKRFRPYTLTQSKEMLPINGIPAIQYSVDECIFANIPKIIIVVRPRDTSIRNYFENNTDYSTYITYDKFFNNDSNIQLMFVEEFETLHYGNAAPLLTVKDKIKESEFFAVLFGDDVILERNAISELKKSYIESNAVSIIATKYKPDDEIKYYGNVMYEANSKRIIRIVQKPKEKISNEVIVSRLILSYDIFKYISNETNYNGEIDLGIALQSQLKKDLVIGIRISGTWISVDNPQRYREALNLAAQYNDK